LEEVDVGERGRNKRDPRETHLLQTRGVELRLINDLDGHLETGKTKIDYLIGLLLAVLHVQPRDTGMINTQKQMTTTAQVKELLLILVLATNI
jgi:hypothetical protein